MANKLAVAVALVAGGLLSGCVSVDNRGGLNMPPAFCSNIKGTVGVPKGPVSVYGAKTARTSASVHLHEWVFSGVSAGLIDMTLQNALSNGELRKVYYADYEQVSLFGFVTVFNFGRPSGKPDMGCYESPYGTPGMMLLVR